MHQPAWSLFDAIKLAGIDPTAADYRIVPELPFQDGLEREAGDAGPAGRSYRSIRSAFDAREARFLTHS